MAQDRMSGRAELLFVPAGRVRNQEKETEVLSLGQSCHCPNSGRAIPKPDTSAMSFARSSP
jgi:hypothetical protein